MQIVFATTNTGKLVEVRAALGDFPVQLISAAEFGACPEVLEDGASFEENALKKARVLAEFSGQLTLADDSGLEVRALGGAPSIRSARYAGDEGNDEKNKELLLRALAGVPEAERMARFVCVLALCKPLSLGGRQWVAHGECEGSIAFCPRGTGGFGYDPLFFYPPLGKTFAELDHETKAKVSHRARALSVLKIELPAILSPDKSLKSPPRGVE